LTNNTEYIYTSIYCTGIYCTGIYCTGIYCTGIYCTGIYCTGIYCTGMLQIYINITQQDRENTTTKKIYTTETFLMLPNFYLS